MRLGSPRSGIFCHLGPRRCLSVLTSLWCIHNSFVLLLKAGPCPLPPFLSTPPAGSENAHPSTLLLALGAGHRGYAKCYFLSWPKVHWLCFFVSCLGFLDSSICMYEMSYDVGFPGGTVGTGTPTSAGDVGGSGSILGGERVLGGRHGSPLWYSCWGIPWTEAPGGLHSL